MAPGSRPSVLATDLDGTLIPLDGDSGNVADLVTLAAELERNAATLVFVTGRDLELARQAIDEATLPVPDWLIADVGTSIYRRDGEKLEAAAAYHEHLEGLVGAMPRPALVEALGAIDGLRQQEPSKQGPHKLSFYAKASALAELVDRLEGLLSASRAPWSIISSVDPFNGDGLIDLLPEGVSKAYALSWWAQHVGGDADAIVFAGDSGNDLAALTAGYRAIVVGNADREVARRAYLAHRERGWRDRLYLASRRATSGVLDGCRWFGLFDAESAKPAGLGATPITSSSAQLRVWAPDKRSVEVELGDGRDAIRCALEPVGDGYFAGTLAAGPGTSYRYVVDGGVSRPDPVSRSQPEGVHGPSEIVDPGGFPWTDQSWTGLAMRDLIIYELHVGTFTAEGTFAAAIDRLPELVELGITAIELMPVNQTPGRWNWGYDGVDLFAVESTYGGPAGLDALVDAAHDAGLAVILDVVYNHLGPEGNYLTDFGPYASKAHRTGWGDALNYDEEGSEHVRRFVVANALYWLAEHHVDGLRLDAVHFCYDDSGVTILDELRSAVAGFAESSGRRVHVFAETNMYDGGLLAESPERPAYDAIWSDCLMHAIYAHALPALHPPGRRYQGAADLELALRRGWVYAGRDARRVADDGASGEPVHESLVVALQTHDRVGSHPRGARLHMLTSKRFQKAAAALVLMHPGVPLIFMGEEDAVDAPFPFFVDFSDEDLRAAVREGRRREHPSDEAWLSPTEPDTFHSAKCYAAELRDPAVRQWYRSLIALRKRGIAEGWLSSAKMVVEHDAEHDVFSLIFDRGAAGAINVRVRLSPASGTCDEAVPIPDGEVLLSSDARGAGPELALAPDHAIITSS